MNTYKTRYWCVHGWYLPTRIRMVSLQAISFLTGSPWFCGVTTQSQKSQASIDARHDSFAAHHVCLLVFLLLLFNCLMRVTSNAHVATGNHIVLHTVQRHNACMRALSDSECDRQVLSQRGHTSHCLNRSVPGVHMT